MHTYAYTCTHIRTDEEALKTLKERVCHLLPPQQDIITKSEEVVIHRAGHPSTVHRIRMGTPACVTPMGLFAPRLLCPIDWRVSFVAVVCCVLPCELFCGCRAVKGCWMKISTLWKYLKHTDFARTIWLKPFEGLTKCICTQARIHTHVYRHSFRK